MSHEQILPQLQLSSSLGAVNSSTIYKAFPISVGDREATRSVRYIEDGSFLDAMIQRALRLIIERGVPIAASITIQGLTIDLGGSLQPRNEGWSDAHKWAVALIVIASIVCLAVAVLVLIYIVLDLYRKAEANKDTIDESHSGAQADAPSHGNCATPLLVCSSDTGGEEDVYSFNFYGDVEGDAGAVV